MDLRLLLRQIAVKHGTEDGASHGQHVLRGEETDASEKPEELVFHKFNTRADVLPRIVLGAQISTLVKLVRKLPVFLCFAAIFPRCAPYLVCGKLLRGPQGPDNEVDISHQLIVKHQGVPKNRAGFTSKPQLLYNIKSSHTAFA